MKLYKLTDKLMKASLIICLITIFCTFLNVGRLIYISGYNSGYEKGKKIYPTKNERELIQCKIDTIKLLENLKNK